MLGHYFYANKPLEQEEVETLFFRLMAGDDDSDAEYDPDEASVATAAKSIAALHQALWPHRDKAGEITSVVSGAEAEDLFRKAWIHAYPKHIKSRGYPITIAGEPFDVKNEKHVNAYFEQGNFCEPNIFEDGWFSMGRGLCIKAAHIFAEIDAARSAAVYDYARAEAAKEKVS